MDILSSRSAKFRRLKPLFLRGAGYVGVAAILVIGMFYASKRSLAAFDEETRRAQGMSVTAPAPGGNNLITVTVHTAAIDHALAGTPIEVRAGVAYDDRIAYWRDAMPIGGSEDSEPIRTVVASRKSGEVIVAVGPLPAHATQAQPGASDSIRGSIVWIDAQPYAVVHRKSVENLIEVKSRQGTPVRFSESAVGVEGEIELRHAS